MVHGNLTLDGSLNVANSGGFGMANYPLFTYTGSLSGNTTLGSTPPGYSCFLNINTAGRVVLSLILRRRHHRVRGDQIFGKQYRHERRSRFNKRPLFCAYLDQPCSAMEPVDAFCPRSV